tara:strand:+ start:81 stop:617 length:537 start_codon:yes stop_codon:yes gene_type:complete
MNVFWGSMGLKSPENPHQNLTISFTDLIKKIYSIKTVSEESSYQKKQLISLIENQKSLIKVLEELFSDLVIFQKSFPFFLKDLLTKIEHGHNFNYHETSIKKFLEHNLNQYMHSNSDHEHLKKAKNISTELLGNYTNFLFMVKILDNDPLFYASFKLMINLLNNDLLNKQVLIKPYND